MRWIMALLAVLSTVFLLMPIHYRLIGQASRAGMLTAKVIPTLMCAAFAGAAFLGGGDRYALLIFIGLCVCAVADVLLDIHFVIGGALFFAGHLFYISAFCAHQPPTLWSIPTFGVMLLLLWLFVWHFRPRIQIRLMFYGVLLYSAALAVVLSFSLPCRFLRFHSAQCWRRLAL